MNSARLRVVVFVLIWSGMWGVRASAFELPGGQLWNSQPVASDKYEWGLSRSFLEQGYWASRIRSSVGSGYTFGLAFGAGSSSFHLGAEAAVHFLSPGKRGLSAAWVSGVFFRRVTPENFMMFRTGPVTGLSLRAGQVRFHPYLGATIAPSWSLGDGRYQTEIRSVLGHTLEIFSAGGLQVWTEVSLGLRGETEAVLGLALPFIVL